MDKKAPDSTAIDDAEQRRLARVPYMQNRELSWLTFDERCLDQGRDETVPLLERLQFVSIFTSNLQEFFMVRVGSLTDLDLLKKPIIDSKSNMTPREQLDAIHERCHELYPVVESIYHEIDDKLASAGVKHLQYEGLDPEQMSYVQDFLATRALPYLSPQIINARHPFPHLENGALYIIVRLFEEQPKKKSEMTKEERAAAKEERKRLKNQGAEGVTIGIVPLPKQAPRLIKVPGEGFQYVLLEDALEANAKSIFDMYTVKHTNIICVTRNADLDSTETADEGEEDYREHMKKILKKRARLVPVRLESKRKLSSTVSKFLLMRLKLKPHQVYATTVPFDMGFAFALPSMVDEITRKRLTSEPFAPSWPGQLRRSERIIDQVQKKDVLLSYPYESMDPFVQLLREAAADPDVVSIKITLYRLASSSHLAEALIAAADAGKEVTALFELRARFDESNNIAWSQRFEEAGCNVIYGFHDYKVHSKICHITRQTSDGLQYITQLGTGNYNEKTAKLYTDFSYITADPAIGRDAVDFFRNMGLENASRNYQTIWVAPLQIKQNILAGIDEQIALAKAGEACGLFFKTNSVTDKKIIEKIAEASQAGVPITLLVRGISCLVPRVEGYTDNVRVVSIVGRLLEHSRIYGFGPRETMRIYLSSADLMTRNMDKRVEIAWPVTGEEPRRRVFAFIDACMNDNMKLRELRSDGTYTPLRALQKADSKPFNAQEHLIKAAAEESGIARDAELSEKSAYEKLSMQAREQRRDEARARKAHTDLAEVYREALNHAMLPEDETILQPYITAAVKAVAEVNPKADVDAMAPAIAAAIAAAMPAVAEQQAAAEELEAEDEGADSVADETADATGGSAKEAAENATADTSEAATANEVSSADPAAETISAAIGAATEAAAAITTATGTGDDAHAGTDDEKAKETELPFEIDAAAASGLAGEPAAAPASKPDPGPEPDLSPAPESVPTTEAAAQAAPSAAAATPEAATRQGQPSATPAPAAAETAEKPQPDSETAEIAEPAASATETAKPEPAKKKRGFFARLFGRK